jgi:hypothetical protein
VRVASGILPPHAHAPPHTAPSSYFKPPKNAVPVVSKKWTDTEKELLLQGLAEYGVGHFREISERLLPEWAPNDLRVKAIRLMGRQNLQLYRGMLGVCAPVCLCASVPA